MLKKAFSLVEISVVILIVSLVVTGVFKGTYILDGIRIANARSITNKSPVIVTPNLTLWLESTSVNSFDEKKLVDNQTIPKWNDINPQKLTKLNFIQTTTANQPKYVEKLINNLPALQFDNQQMLAIDNLKISELVSSNQATIFMVQNSLIGDASTSAFGWNSGSYRLLTHTGDGSVVFDFGVCCSGSSRLQTASISNFLNRNIIITYRKNLSKNDIYVNLNERTASSSASTDSIPGDLTGTFAIGKFPPDNFYWFYGFIGEFIVFDRALTDGEKLKIEQYLSDKWSIKLKY